MDNDRIAGSAKDFAGNVEGAVGGIAGSQAAGVAREATETLRDGSQAVAKKVEDYPLGALLVAIGVGFALGVADGGSAAPPAAALARLLGPVVHFNTSRLAGLLDAADVGRCRLGRHGVVDDPAHLPEDLVDLFEIVVLGRDVDQGP
jgi:hypothetical protein